MKLNAANIIAVELAVLIGLMSWLVYSRFPSTETRNAAEMRESMAAPVATVVPDGETKNQRPAMAEYRPDQLAQLVAEQQALIRYQQEIAPRPHPGVRSGNGSIAADSMAYSEVNQKPATTSSEDVSSPQTVAYVQPEPVVYPQPAQAIVYSQPVQIVVFSNSRRFANRHRSMPHHPGPPLPIPNRCPDRGEPNLSGSTESRPTKSFGIVHQRDAVARTRRLPQEFRPRDHR